MSAPAPLRTICISGDRLMAHVVALFLDGALAQHGCRVTLGDLDDLDRPGSTCLLGQKVVEALAALGLPPQLLAEAGGSVQFHWSLRDKAIMCAPFGTPNWGVDFHQHLHRIEGSLSHDMLLPFSPSHVAGEHWPQAQALERAPTPFGMRIARGALLDLLAARLEHGDRKDADFTFDVRGDGAAEWHGQALSIPASSSFPELALYRCMRAAQRFLALLPGAEGSAPSAREFNRLSAAEDDRIMDFAAMLVRKTDRPALARKIAVFSACGRIPLEDYELFPPHQWIGLFLQSGIAPQDYDRIADRIPEAQVRRWIDGLRVQMERLAAAGAT